MVRSRYCCRGAMQMSRLAQLTILAGLGSGAQAGFACACILTHRSCADQMFTHVPLTHTPSWCTTTAAGLPACSTAEWDANAVHHSYFKAEHQAGFVSGVGEPRKSHVSNRSTCLKDCLSFCGRVHTSHVSLLNFLQVATTSALSTASKRGARVGGAKARMAQRWVANGVALVL